MLNHVAPLDSHLFVSGKTQFGFWVSALVRGIGAPGSLGESTKADIPNLFVARRGGGARGGGAAPLAQTRPRRMASVWSPLCLGKT